MKRSARIALVLLSGASVGAIAGCTQSQRPVRITAESVYVNDYFVPGVGYYHAPFHAFFSYPYNFFNATTHLYYFGGQWGPAPFQSPVNISSPTANAVVLAEAQRTDVVRGGFGSYSGGYFGS